MKNNRRLCMYTYDVVLITGKSKRQARWLLNEMRKALKKKRRALITIPEFCAYMHLDEEKVYAILSQNL